MAESDVGCWINRPTPFHLLPAIKYFLSSCCWITEWMEGWRQFFLLQHFLLVHSHLSQFCSFVLIYDVPLSSHMFNMHYAMSCHDVHFACAYVLLSYVHCTFVPLSLCVCVLWVFCLWSEVVNVSFCNFPLPMVCMCNRHLNCACACAFVQPACALCMCRKHQKSAMWLSCNVMAVPHSSVQIGCSSFPAA